MALKHVNNYFLTGVILVVSQMVAALLAWSICNKNQDVIARSIEDSAITIANDVVQRIQLYQYGLAAARGVAITAGNNLSRELFARYSISRNLEEEFPGARGFGFIRRVPQAEEADFIARARRDNYPQFDIQQLTRHDNERFVIQYLEPVVGNEAAIGLDIASESNRRNAAIAAMNSGEVRLTGPITLVQRSGDALQSFLMLMPIYPEPRAPVTLAQRQQQAYGWVYAPLLMKEVLADIERKHSMLHLSLRDVTDKGVSTVVFDSTHRVPEQGGAESADAAYSHTLIRSLFGRQWQIVVSPHPEFIAGLNLPRVKTTYATASLIGLLAAMFVFALVAGGQLRRQSLQQKERMAALVESSQDAIITCDNDGRVVSWNYGAEALFKFDRHEVVGAVLSDLIVPEEYAAEEQNILQRLRLGLTLPQLITKRADKDDRCIDVSIVVAPVVEAGQVIGYAKTIRNISEQVRTQQKIIELNKNLESLVSVRTLELEDSQRTLQGILDSIPSYVAYWDRDMRNIIMNQRYLDRFGMTQQEVRGKTFNELVGDNSYVISRHLIETAFATGEIQSQNLSSPGITYGPKHVLMYAVPEIVDNEIRGMYTLIQDVTELHDSRVRIELLLRENEALLATINQQMLYSVTDVAGTIISANDNFCNASGYGEQELLGQNHRLLSSGVHSPEFWQKMWAQIGSGKSWRGEVCNRTKNGELRWFDSVIAPFVGADGAIERYVALRTDITDRRAVEAEHNKLMLLLSNVLDAASEVSIIVTDTEGLITIFNTGAVNMLGYSAEEVIGKQTPALFHLEEEVVLRGNELSREFADERIGPIQGFEAFVYLARRNKSEIAEWTYVRKGGARLRVSLAVTAMYDRQGVITGYLGIAVDITERTRSQRELISIRDQLTTAAAVADLGVWSWDMATHELRWNQRMLDLYQLPSSQANSVTYEQWLQWVHPEDIDPVRSAFNAARAGVTDDWVFRIIRADGEVRFIQAAAQVERDSNGVAVKLTGINRDITEQLHLEQELRQAKELADSSNAAKSAFLANMSHEIRTPMNAVLGMLQLVRRTGLNERQSDYIDRADIAAKSLLGLLNDILDVSKIEVGKLVLEQHSFDVDQLMRDLGVVLSSYQGVKNVELLFDIDPALPRLLNGDALRLQQILLNLGGNALKFTEAGQVIIRLIQQQRSVDSVTLRIDVEDTGIGISEDQRERIFESFTQAEASTTRRFGGSGLGLLICRRLVELMGGTLQVDSELGKGSRFWFTVTLGIVDEQPLVVATAAATILLVEDNHLVADTIAAMLRGLGYQVDTVHTAAAALDRVQQTERVYDLVLMDWMLPDLSGLRVAEYIAALATRQPPKVIIITAHAQKILDAELPAQAAYYCGVLTKPLTPTQLDDAIGRALAGRPLVDVIDKQPQHRHRLKNLWLLVVEDNDFNRQVAAEMLAQEGARVELAEGGLEGVAKVLRTNHRYDLVIMDMQMPDIDGLEATRRIRADGRFNDLPIVAMTANASSADRDACLAAGMTAHLGKPIDMEQVVPLVLQLTCADPILEVGVAIAGSGLASALTPAAQVLQRFGGNVGLFQRVQAAYYPDIIELLNKFKQAHAYKDTVAMQAALHAIKGMASAMGVIGLANFVAMLEQRLRVISPLAVAQDIQPAHINQLQELIDNSHIMLTDLAAKLTSELTAESNASSVTTPPSTDAELGQQLRQLVPLLEVGNLWVLDKIESVYAGASAEQQRQLEILLRQIGALDFEAATITIKTLLQENAWM